MYYFLFLKKSLKFFHEIVKQRQIYRYIFPPPPQTNLYVRMCKLCNAESQEMSAKGYIFKEDDRAFPI